MLRITNLTDLRGLWTVKKSNPEVNVGFKEKCKMFFEKATGMTLDIGVAGVLKDSVCVLHSGGDCLDITNLGEAMRSMPEFIKKVEIAAGHKDGAVVWEESPAQIVIYCYGREFFKEEAIEAKTNNMWRNNE